MREALCRLTATKQPVLFLLQDKYYVKVNSTAVEVDSAACFYDAVEFLLSLFHVLDVSYEHELKPTFGFLEKVMKLPVSTVRSCAVLDLWRVLSRTSE